MGTWDRRIPRWAGVARFIGVQPGLSGTPGIALYNLVISIPGHPAGSTVSAATLERWDAEGRPKY